MKKILLAIIITFGFLFSVFSQEKPTSTKSLPIMAWSGMPLEETTLERFIELKDMGITISLATYPDIKSMRQALDLAHRAGLKMVASCPELKNDCEKTVVYFKDHPALAGYFLRDEPVRKDFDELGEWARKISAADPKHFCFVNLIAAIHPTKTEALGSGSYPEFLRTFADIVPVAFISYDFYPVLTEGLHEFWYEGLEIVAAESRKLGKPFWAFALASSYNELHPLPTIPALRIQQFSNLAYGAQGLEYWSYWMSPGLRSAPIDLNGRRTDVYDRIKSVNMEIKNLGWVFAGAKVVSVSHTGVVIPRGTTRVTALPWAVKVLETEGSGALVSILENGANSFCVVINRDLEKNMPLIIHGDKRLNRVLKDGTVVSAARYAGRTELEPGDMAVYMFPTKEKE